MAKQSTSPKSGKMLRISIVSSSPCETGVRYLSLNSSDFCGESLLFRYLHYPLLWTREYRFLADATTNPCSLSLLRPGPQLFVRIAASILRDTADSWLRVGNP